jgi:hypothetical protein
MIHGGSRIGAGRPKATDKKERLDLWFKKSFIDEKGGKKQAKKYIYEAIAKIETQSKNGDL